MGQVGEQQQQGAVAIGQELVGDVLTILVDDCDAMIISALIDDSALGTAGMVTGHIFPTIILIGQAVDGKLLFLSITAVDEDEVIFSLLVELFGGLRHEWCADRVGAIVNERLDEVAIVGYGHDECE